MSELLPKQNIKGSLAETKNSLDSSAEIPPAKPRFLVFGSRISGAFGLANSLEEHLVNLGFEDPKVDAVRDAAFIEAAFYNVRPVSDSPEIESSVSGGRLRRLGRSLLRCEVSTREAVKKDVPRGVIVFPTMRQYTPSGMGMFIHSPRDFIQELCDTNKVPVIFMEDIQTQADLAISVSTFAAEPK